MGKGPRGVAGGTATLQGRRPGGGTRAAARSGRPTRSWVRDRGGTVTGVAGWARHLNDGAIKQPACQWACRIARSRKCQSQTELR